MLKTSFNFKLKLTDRVDMDMGFSHERDEPVWLELLELAKNGFCRLFHRWLQDKTLPESKGKD